MDYHIEQVDTRKVAGFHLVGPWDKTVKQGFEQLTLWVDSLHVQPLEWLAVYYDNPDNTPAEKLRCATVVRVDDDFTVPDNSAGIILTEIESGEYAIASVRVENDDFETPWREFFDRLLQDGSRQIAPRPCIEIYHNDGKADGYWDIDMYIPLASA
ncbi:DNA gyrase inhibitor SbmC [Superficieibacter electus]|uniref:DNA gyrase inhibitor n=1 Tax=Superficieibacter electus TaxID=2022662 RepID=A0A2P5GVW1_9ENTR|nr:DNA gyrase inhibitor SbmC [Superficieibacter electus]POP47671.1 DNA gyrase inhibitor SbmC [Superficieibacter electus]POP50682.1 DNA gyrase inhibitor SbmC [Superficieibacter electus]